MSGRGGTLKSGFHGGGRHGFDDGGFQAERDQADIPSREALAESSFQATRHGLGAKLLNRRGEAITAYELARECLESVADLAVELRCEAELEHVRTILDEGTGADLQRRVLNAHGIEGLLDYLVRETAR